MRTNFDVSFTFLNKPWQYQLLTWCF